MLKKFKNLIKKQTFASKVENHKTIKLQNFLEKQGFTLVELIIVIAIIGILVLLAVLHLSKASVKSRDATRMSNVRHLQEALEVSYVDINKWTYPMVETGTYVTLFSGSIELGYQGIITKEIIDKINMSKMVKDPDGSEYTYLITKNRRHLQLMSMLENQTNLTYLNSVYAIDNSNRFPFLVWTPLGITVVDTTEWKNIPIQFINGLTGLDLTSLDNNYTSFVKKEEEYSWLWIKNIALFDY